MGVTPVHVSLAQNAGGARLTSLPLELQAGYRALLGFFFFLTHLPYEPLGSIKVRKMVINQKELWLATAFLPAPASV